MSSKDASKAAESNNSKAAEAVWKSASASKDPDHSPKSKNRQQSPHQRKRRSQNKRKQAGGRVKPDSAAQAPRYQPKLLTEENEEEKTVLIKITRVTGIRQVINFSIGKLKNDWMVTFNAFTMDMTKVLQATEIIKTRLPFLHQENKLITYASQIEIKTQDKDGEEKVIHKNRVRSGIQVTLSRNQFDVSDQAGYQKPKPRQFMQPLPLQRPKKQAEEKEEIDAKDDFRKKKRQPRRKSKKEKQSQDDDQESDHHKDQKPNKKEEKKQGGRNREDRRRNSRRKQDPESYREDQWMPYGDGRYDPLPPRSRGPGGPPQKMFDSDFDHDQRGMRYETAPGGRYRHPNEMYRGPPPEYFRSGPSAMFGRNGPMPPRYQQKPGGRGGSWGNGGPPPRREFDRPERPGYYSGNRPFRMDKIRDQPLEKLHKNANDQIEQERIERLKKNSQQQQRDARDQRNRPGQTHGHHVYHEKK